LDRRAHLGGAVLKLALELAHKKRRLFLISNFEDVPDAYQYRPGNRRDRRRHGERKQQEQLLP
jgi:hypothetical protein